MTFFIIIFLVISLIVIWNIFGYSGESRTYIIENEVEYKRAVDAFNDLYKGECYVSFSLDEQWRIKYKHLDDKQKKCSTYFLPKKIRELVNDFKICFNTDENVRKDFNNEFVEKEKILNKDSFDSLLEYSLNDQQRDAILHDEDNSLIIAGAGTGKTTAIMGKIGYLLEKGLATEEEILLIAFGKDAAIDMRKKWSKLKLKKNKINDVKIKTFHALGYDIIGEIEGDKHMLAFGGPPNSEKEAKEFLTNKLYDKDLDKSIRVLVASFFLYHLFPEPEVESFATLDEYISYVKSIKLITFQGEIVKSYEELQIANFLYLNNIKYAYEKVFDENIKNAKFTAYKPDFYLTDYGITIEHFGIDEKGRVPKYFSSENAIDASAKYRAKMDYARKIHSEYGRVLIETYSYESKGDSLLPKLNEKLKNNGVVMKQRSLEDILSKIEVSKTFQPFINLMYTFIVLAKSNDVSADFLKKATGKNASKRVKTFIEIFGYLFNEYESYLKKQGEIDFSDMINLAKEHVLSDKYKHRYKYILVDEFQDMSIGRYKFLKALIGKSGETKLFCVGDDWQSIYRFSGSDLSITTTFSKYFGYTHKAQLELTH
ncbi:MAG: DNA helicase-4, partial [Saprospiraceae bacterium]